MWIQILHKSVHRSSTQWVLNCSVFSFGQADEDVVASSCLAISQRWTWDHMSVESCALLNWKQPSELETRVANLQQRYVHRPASYTREHKTVTNPLGLMFSLPVFFLTERWPSTCNNDAARRVDTDNIRGHVAATVDHNVESAHLWSECAL